MKQHASHLQQRQKHRWGLPTRLILEELEQRYGIGSHVAVDVA